MSVMTGDTFAKICFTLWGKNWKAPAAERLERTERHLRRIANRPDTAVGSQLRNELLELVREQRTVLQSYEREYSD